MVGAHPGTLAGEGSVTVSGVRVAHPVIVGRGHDQHLPAGPVTGMTGRTLCGRWWTAEGWPDADISCRQCLAAYARPAEPAQCRVFLRCARPAGTTIAHPTLGAVPACQRCADWYVRMGAS